MSGKKSIINGVSLVCGIAGCVFALVCLMLSGSPIDMIHKLNNIGVLPPMWIFDLMILLWYFLIGAALGGVIKSISVGGNCGSGTVSAYKGIAFFLITFFMGLIWYPVFFVSQAIFISLLVSIISSVAAMLCAYSWLGSGENAEGVIIAAYSIWTVYVFIINLSVCFGI